VTLAAVLDIDVLQHRLCGQSSGVPYLFVEALGKIEDALFVSASKTGKGNAVIISTNAVRHS
jgi:hypothetical protein